MTRPIITILLPTLFIVLATAFGTLPICFISNRFFNIQNPINQCTYDDQRITSSSLSNLPWLSDRWKDFTTNNVLQNLDSKSIDSSRNTKTSKDGMIEGKVIRCGARTFRKDSSKPSSEKYTTHKNELPLLKISSSGVTGDYNHYRTSALSSTKDRAISILTNDVIKVLRNEGVYFIEPGNLGENILVDKITYRYFQVGNKYFIGDTSISSTSDQSNDIKTRRGVEIEITEPIVPCANLCKLSLINKFDLEPKFRVKRCKEFIERLDRHDGFRGWYAKILSHGGEVRLGDGIRLLQ